MSGASYGRTARAEEISDYRNKDVRDLTREEALIEVGRLVGYNNGSSSQLTKRCLWSCYWALTGEEYCPRRNIGTAQSPHTGDLRFAVARNAGFFYSTENKSQLKESPEDVPGPRPFRNNQLRALVYALRNSPDQRPHGLQRL
jgi:hypothetical protein